MTECEDADLCPGSSLEIRFTEELPAFGDFAIDLEHDGSVTTCSVTLPENSLWLGTCRPEDLLGAGGASAPSLTAGAAGAELRLPAAERTQSCSNGKVGIRYACGIDRISFFDLRPDTVTVTVHRDGKLLLTETLTPTYQTFQPHKKGCGLPCNAAVETITTP